MLLHNQNRVWADQYKVLDTLQLENLDMNELQGSLQALELLMIEFADQLLAFSKKTQLHGTTK